jgi:hypothetical protein
LDIGGPDIGGFFKTDIGGFFKTDIGGSATLEAPTLEVSILGIYKLYNITVIIQGTDEV